MTSDYEFYPVDPISRLASIVSSKLDKWSNRGLWKRLNLHPCLPFSHPMDQNPPARARQSFLNPRLEDADYSSSLVSHRDWSALLKVKLITKLFLEDGKILPVL